MKQKEVFAKDICFKKIFWLFMIGCVVGCFIEVINHFIHFGNIVSRSGLIYGPLNPVYGFGIVLFVLCFSKVKNPIYIFIGGMFLGGGFEYLYEVPVEHIDLTFDSPYLFLIRDVDTGEVWFTGTVYEPTEYVPYY